jgi:integrase
MQSGQIKLVGKCWLLRYWESVRDESGNVVRRRKAVKLATYSDKYRKESDVRKLAVPHLAPQNAQTARAESTDTVAHFLEHVYLPWVKVNKRPSTYKSYSQMIDLAKDHLGDIELRDFHTPEAEKLIHDATSDRQRAHTTHRNLKAVLSAAFTFAKRNGAVIENPIRDISIPRGKPAGDTHAYTLDEIHGMLAVLSEPARTLVLLASLTGLGAAELKGLRWEDFTGDELMISRNVWNGKITSTKTRARTAPVPVLDIVKKALEEQRKRTKGVGFIFPARQGKPIRLENLLRRDMRPELDEAKITWHGWHAFRRGLATNLYTLGVDSKTIQAILRHANVSTTMAYYVKPVAAESVAAMRKMESAFTKSAKRAKKLA